MGTTWTYDKNGFVNPGTLSLFEPSMHLTNYDLDALAQIDVKGLGLVFRAASSRDYQVARLVVEGSGPMPSLALARYAMISGSPHGPFAPHTLPVCKQILCIECTWKYAGTPSRFTYKATWWITGAMAGWPAAAWACSAGRANMLAWPGSAFRTMQTP